MSYPIIFETKVVKLSDGRIIHFEKSGCNNDNVGRHKNEFKAKIYSVDEFVEKAKSFQQSSLPYKMTGEMDLKIGNRDATMYDYGRHLLTMLNRVVAYEVFIRDYHFEAEHVIGIQLYSPEYKFMTCEEFDKVANKLLFSGNLSYRRVIEHPDTADENEIIKLIEAKEPLEFEIRKKSKEDSLC